ncbi:MAG TPA: hypothetical protein VGE65_09835 [Sphingobium sp.]
MNGALLALGGLSTMAVAATAIAQAPNMSRDEARQLYAAGGFPISADDNGPTNRCGQAANPKITFLDLNGDKKPDALFTDAGACYGMDQRWFAMATKDTAGRWRGLGGFPGTANAVSVGKNGWLILTWTSKGSTQTLAYNGQGYAVGGAATTSPPPAATARAAPAPAAAKPATAAPASAAQSPAARDAAIFRAAGFKQTRRGWESGCDDPSAGAAYGAGSIEQVKDLNGDGRPDAVVIESGSYCYGNTGQAFWLVSQQANGSWKLLHSETGIAEFLATRGVGGWPDISIGGPGFCFPVVRWNGTAYKFNRNAYEGKPCKPNR